MYRSANISCSSDTITKTNPYNGQLHLENDETATPADGKVEVRLYNKWHPVCKNSAFTKTVADSMCDNMDTQKVKIYRLYILRFNTSNEYDKWISKSMCFAFGTGSSMISNLQNYYRTTRFSVFY